MKISSKQKQKLYIKFLKSKNPEDKLIYKNYKNLFYENYTNLFEKLRKQIQAKSLFEPIRNTQSQRKTTMTDLERNHRKSSEEKSVSTDNTCNGKQNYLIKNAIAEEFNTFLRI